MATRKPVSFSQQVPWHYLHAQWRRFFGLNVSPVEPLLFVGGQFRAAQWPLLHRMGIRAVLSLQAEREDIFPSVSPDRALRLPVVDHSAPSLQQLEAGVAFMSESFAAGLPVLVHCRAGVGRAPLTAAAYLMQQRAMPYREAVAYLLAARPIIRMNGIQLRRLMEWEQHLCTTG